MITARRTERLEALAGELVGWVIALALPMDVTDADSVNRALTRLNSNGVWLMLVNNAGIGDPVMFLNMTEGNWRSMLSTNLTVHGGSRTGQPGHGQGWGRVAASSISPRSSACGQVLR